MANDVCQGVSKGNSLDAGNHPSMVA
jgi:hypothetical protein